ncbi:hypothetical protein J6590_013033 [Homalodisca vitripennis]|nr:hypothetical protein J6590_013033 [Homalodisca vitripennis]
MTESIYDGSPEPTWTMEDGSSPSFDLKKAHGERLLPRVPSFAPGNFTTLQLIRVVAQLTDNMNMGLVTMLIKLAHSPLSWRIFQLFSSYFQDCRLAILVGLTITGYSPCTNIIHVVHLALYADDALFFVCLRIFVDCACLRSNISNSWNHESSSPGRKATKTKYLGIVLKRNLTTKTAAIARINLWIVSYHGLSLLLINAYLSPIGEDLYLVRAYLVPYNICYDQEKARSLSKFYNAFHDWIAKIRQECSDTSYHGSTVDLRTKLIGSTQWLNSLSGTKSRIGFPGRVPHQGNCSDLGHC